MDWGHLALATRDICSFNRLPNELTRLIGACTNLRAAVAEPKTADRTWDPAVTATAGSESEDGLTRSPTFVFAIGSMCFVRRFLRSFSCLKCASTPFLTVLATLV